LIRRIRKITLAAGVVTLVLSIAMALAGSASHPATSQGNPGFTSAVLWLELVRSPEEAFAALGSPVPGGDVLRARIDRVNRIDLVFLVAYSLLNCGALWIFAAGARRRPGPGRPLATLALSLALVMAVGDAVEDAQLFVLTRARGPGDVGAEVISLLRCFSDAKWTALFVALGVGGALWALPRRSSRVAWIAAVPLASAAIGLVGIWSIPVTGVDLRYLTEAATGGMSLCWLLALIAVWRSGASNGLNTG
jgi:hypothetical protein